MLISVYKVQRRLILDDMTLVYFLVTIIALTNIIPLAFAITRLHKRFRRSMGWYCNITCFPLGCYSSTVNFPKLRVSAIHVRKLATHTMSGNSRAYWKKCLKFSSDFR